MGEIDVIVTSETAEISHDTLSGGDIVIVKSPTLPLGKRKGNLKFHIFEIARSEGGGTLNSVQVVIESRALGQEHGAGHALQVDIGLELVFEGGLDEGEGLFFLEKVDFVSNFLSQN